MKLSLLSAAALSLVSFSALASSGKILQCTAEVSDWPNNRTDGFTFGGGLDNIPELKQVLWTSYATETFAQTYTLDVTSVAVARCPGCYLIEASNPNVLGNPIVMQITITNGKAISVQYKATLDESAGFAPFTVNPGTCREVENFR